MKLKVILLASLLTALILFGSTQVSLALECSDEVWIYDDFESEELYEEADLFADTSFLKWGTLACQLATKPRFLTKWIQVRIEDGRTGWVKEQSLFSEVEYLNRIAERISEHTRQISELQKNLNRLKAEKERFNSTEVSETEGVTGTSSEQGVENGAPCQVWLQEIQHQAPSSDQILQLYYCY